MLLGRDKLKTATEMQRMPLARWFDFVPPEMYIEPWKANPLKKQRKFIDELILQ